MPKSIKRFDEKDNAAQYDKTTAELIAEAIQVRRRRCRSRIDRRNRYGADDVIVSGNKLPNRSRLAESPSNAVLCNGGRSCRCAGI